MPAWRLSMRKIKEILRLKFENHLTNHRIARSCDISRPTVAHYLAKANAAGLSWPIAEGLDDLSLEKLLFPLPRGETPRTEAVSKPCRPQPDLPRIHQELRHKHVTLQLLWEEYKTDHLDGYQYSQFCDLYHRWARQLDVSLRQEHKAGDKLFIDYAGPTLPVVSGETGQSRQACLFVAVLGASNYTYVEATFSQQLPSWIASHVRTFQFLGGAPACLVPDNLRAGVSRPCRYEPDLNPAYQEMASYYGMVVMPARVRKPRDKAKAEAGVLLAERWILAVLRHRTFFSLAELNEAIWKLLEKLNHHPFRKLNTTRARLFEQLDRPALRPLPTEPFQWFEIKKARVNIDYHIELEGHYYSVPYGLVQQEVEARLSASIVEILHQGQRVTTHLRSSVRGAHTTLAEHRPQHHRAYLEWTPGRMLGWAETVGPATSATVGKILESRTYPEQGFRSCLGLLRLGKRYSNSRLEAACTRAFRVGACSYKSVKSILETGLDRHPLEPEPFSPSHQRAHVNVRGAAYYQGKGVADAQPANL